MKAKRKPRLTPEDVLNTVGMIRRNNLRGLVGAGKRFTTQTELANTLGHTDSYLSQMIGPKPIRRVTETTARKFEYKLGLPTGSLDLVGGAAG